MVGENAIAFSCSEAWNFHLATGSQTFSGRRSFCAVDGLARRRLVRPIAGRLNPAAAQEGL